MKRFSAADYPVQTATFSTVTLLREIKNAAAINEYFLFKYLVLRDNCFINTRKIEIFFLYILQKKRNEK
jgi:hypothetical protein